MLNIVHVDDDDEYPSSIDITDHRQGLRLEEGTHGPSLLTIFNSSNIEDDVNRDTNNFQGTFSRGQKDSRKSLNVYLTLWMTDILWI